MDEVIHRPDIEEMGRTLSEISDVTARAVTSEMIAIRARAFTPTSSPNPRVKRWILKEK